ncbi:HK97 family phage prohead protease [Mesobacterium sp. TK19101]|uniref:HK97 family phage prohead protease n=1 Tax=Mesobacterium hydrothermale TaxID=3111907 RepID=A0ABU6HIR2_9RHOB|nr:HK97 family phage prohead protease [Mesobacterium sp. TK19101]MEC3862216.1 HK97 family phage prohead protease [Mesobacterium sp. TK19101]
MELEHKFCRIGADVTVTDGTRIAGYASLFGAADQGGDVVAPGAYALSLERLAEEGRGVKMLWQHDPAQPIGVWDEVREDGRGLYVKGRLLEGVGKAREAAALIAAGAIDGLSIGYRTRRAAKNDQGLRVLTELELWEVSLVTFPMLPSARVAAKGEGPTEADLRELARSLEAARRELTGG